MSPTNFFRSPFFTKLLSWEYWPVYIANIPTVLFWLYFALRSRQLFFFSVVNPVIETGGVLGESKSNILKRIPREHLPITLFLTKDAQVFPQVANLLKAQGISYPLIVKPDIGERGFLVAKIENEAALQAYFQQVNVAVLVQEFVDSPLEISVFYYRFPDAKEGTVTSVCLKKMLTVTGDGQSSIAELMQAYPRASLQLDRFKQDAPELLTKIPASGEEVLLEPIGNHCRGTTFLNGNHLIDDQLSEVFNAIGQQMDGIYYGRFDMKCTSVEALKMGKGFKILEFNGVAGEPAHIYDPAYPIRKAYADIFKHWSIIYQISKIQRSKGVQAMTWSEAVHSYQNYRAYLQSAKTVH